MLAFQAFHLAAYHFAHGTFQPPAASSALGCSDLDGLLSGGPGPVDLNAALDVCFRVLVLARAGATGPAWVRHDRSLTPVPAHPGRNPNATLLLTPNTLTLALILTP